MATKPYWAGGNHQKGQLTVDFMDSRRHERQIDSETALKEAKYHIIEGTHCNSSKMHSYISRAQSQIYFEVYGVNPSSLCFDVQSELL